MTDNASQCGAITRQLEAQMTPAPIYARDVAIVVAQIAARPDAGEPADYPEFPTRAAMFASMLGLDNAAVTAPVPQTARQHLAFGHVVTRKPVLS